MRGSTSKHVSEADLKLVFHLSEMKAPYDGVDIVVVPDLWAEHAQEKNSKHCSWLKVLVASTDNDTRVFVFKYKVVPDGDGSIWYRLLALGSLLLDSLRQARPVEVQGRPLFFICHGVGGLILKSAVNKVHQSLQHFHHIRNALAGVIFLGSPHLTNPDDERWENWWLLLKLSRKDITKSCLRDDDIKTLAGVCKTFTQLKLVFPIISVFETVPTKVHDSGFLGRLKGTDRILVDESLATVQRSNEELFGTASSHLDLRLVGMDTPLFRRLVEFLNLAPVAGLELVSHSFQRMEYAPSDTASLASKPAQKATSMADFENPEPPTTLSLPCYSLGHNRNPSFFGQQDVLRLIDEALLPSVGDDDEEAITTWQASGADGRPTALSMFAICGMGGLGKSEIAIEYIHSRKLSFDAIFWLNAASTQKLDAGFRDVAVKLGLLGPNDAGYDDPAAVRGVVKGWLVNSYRVRGLDDLDPNVARDAKWLIVFDNADDPEILHDFWPTGGRGSILITSRHPLAKNVDLARESGIDLSPMATETAGDLLRKVSLRESEPDSQKTAAQIASRLGGLPLALVQVAYGIRKKNLSLAELAENYEHYTGSFQAVPIHGLTKEQAVASTWSLDSMSESAQALLRVLSVLDPDYIPEEILTKGANSVGLPNYPKAKTDYFEAREQLTKSSLVSRNIEHGFLKIHRLVQDVVRQKLNAEELRAVFQAGVTLVSAVWPFADTTNVRKVAFLRIVRKYSPHVIMLRSVLEERTLEVVQPQAGIASLFNDLAWHYVLDAGGNNLFDGQAFARLSQRILDNLGAVGGCDENTRSRLLANSYRYQGIIGHKVGDPDAVPCCKKWIAILVDRIEKYQDPGDSRTLPIAYNETGTALMRAGLPEEAKKSWAMACEILEKNTAPGDLPFPYPWYHRSLVTAYAGDPATGVALLAPVLEARAKKLGKDDTNSIETGLLLGAMGSIMWCKGDTDKSHEFYKRSFEVEKVTLGERSPWAFQVYYGLARSLFARKQYSEAAELLRKCVNFYGDLPLFKLRAARACWKLGHSLLAKDWDKDDEEANQLLERAMKLRRELVPDDDRDEKDLTDIDWDEIIFYDDR